MEGYHLVIYQFFLFYQYLLYVSIFVLAFHKNVAIVTRNEEFVSVAALPSLLPEDLLLHIIHKINWTQFGNSILEKIRPEHRKCTDVHKVDEKVIVLFLKMKISLTNNQLIDFEDEVVLNDSAVGRNLIQIVLRADASQQNLPPTHFPSVFDSYLDVAEIIGISECILCSEYFESRGNLGTSDIDFEYSQLNLICLPAFEPNNHGMVVASLYYELIGPLIISGFEIEQGLGHFGVDEIGQLHAVIFILSPFPNAYQLCLRKGHYLRLFCPIDHELIGMFFDRLLFKVDYYDVISVRIEDEGLSFVDHFEVIHQILKGMLHQYLARSIAMHEYLGVVSLIMGQQGKGVVVGRKERQNFRVAFGQLQLSSLREYHRLQRQSIRLILQLPASYQNAICRQLCPSCRISFQLSPFIIVMFRLITTLPLWGLHFTKQMSTAPLAKVNKTLGKFIADRVPLEKYEPSFSAYQTFIEESIFNNTEVDHQKIILLDQVTKIYEIYKLPSKKLLKLQNKLALECFEWATTKGVSETISVLACVQRYNPRKALALFKSQKQTILKELRSLSSASIMLLLRFLKQQKIDEPLVRETAIEMLYSEINMFNQVQLLNLLDCLAWSKKYINKEFLIRVGLRVLALYKSGSIEDKYIYNILSHISEIQVNLHSRSVYVAELDELYELILPSVFLNINSISDVQLNRLASAFRRSKYYDEAMIQQLITTCMAREIREFNGSGQKGSNLSIQLRTFANIVNTVAVFNFKSTEFKAYTLGILKLLMSSDRIMLPAHIFSRLLWSICVLYERHEVAQIYPLIEGYLERADEIPLHQAMNFYYCYLYLRTSHPRISENKDKIYKLLSGFHLETKSSSIQSEVYSGLLQIGVPCLSEYNLNNIICDIMIPEWNNIKNVIIEIHGFRHFFRNVKKLTGANALKTKIVAGEMYGYYFISADEWMILEDKKAFLKQFIEHVNELEGKKRSSAVATTVPATGRIRSRPRTFRIGS